MPAPNNPNPAQNFTANFSSINDYDSGLFRFDWRINSRHDLMVALRTVRTFTSTRPARSPPSAA